MSLCTLVATFREVVQTDQSSLWGYLLLSLTYFHEGCFSLWELFSSWESRLSKDSGDPTDVNPWATWFAQTMLPSCPPWARWIADQLRPAPSEPTDLGPVMPPAARAGSLLGPWLCPSFLLPSTPPPNTTGLSVGFLCQSLSFERIAKVKETKAHLVEMPHPEERACCRELSFISRYLQVILSQWFFQPGPSQY